MCVSELAYKDHPYSEAVFHVLAKKVRVIQEFRNILNFSNLFSHTFSFHDLRFRNGIGLKMKNVNRSNNFNIKE